MSSRFLQDVYNTSFQRIIRGRPIKPTQKVQEMEWTVVRGQGRRGRESHGG